MCSTGGWGCFVLRFLRKCCPCRMHKALKPVQLWPDSAHLPINFSLGIWPQKEHVIRPQSKSWQVSKLVWKGCPWQGVLHHLLLKSTRLPGGWDNISATSHKSGMLRHADGPCCHKRGDEREVLTSTGYYLQDGETWFCSNIRLMWFRRGRASNGIKRYVLGH